MVSQPTSDSERVALTPLVRAALDGWQADLLDLTRGNRLLVFKPTAHALAITQPVPGELFAGLVNHDRSYTVYRPVPPTPMLATDEHLEHLLAPDPDPDAENHHLPPTTAVPPGVRPPRADEIAVAGDPKRIETTLYRFRSKSRSALQEQGTNVLFVAFGLLDWAEVGFSEGRILSPLLLVPVRLDRETALAPYKIVPLDEDVVLNPSLVQKLARDFKLNLTLPDEEEEDLKLDATLDALRAQVAAQADWQVRAEAYLGLFSFAKYAMYADLDANRARIGQHPVVRLISDEPDGLPEPITDLPSAEALDAQMQPSAVYQVLDADASQQEAIAAVKGGANLIIQGPPGTGKSQTITNIIAEALAAEKTVLFVSEKIAALKVVAKRLAEAGLSEFCLEAHSQDANKAVIIKELDRTLRAERQVAADNAALDLARLATLRANLNAFVQALHDTNNPLGLSAFQVHGEIAHREDAPVISFTLPAIETLTQPRLAQLIDTVQRLTRAGDVLLAAESHPWYGATVPVFTPQMQIEFRDRLDRLAATADELADVQATLTARWGLTYAHSLDAADWLRGLLAILDTYPMGGIPYQNLQPVWFEPSQQASLLALARESWRWLEVSRAGRATLSARFTDAIYAFATNEMVARFEGPYASWTRTFNGDYRRDLNALRGLQHTPASLGYDEALLALRMARDVRVAETWLTAHAAESAAFGPLFTWMTTNWPPIVDVLDWAGRLLQHFGGAPPVAFVDALRAGRSVSTAERSRLDADSTAVHGFIEALRTAFEPDTYGVGGVPPEQAELTDVAAWARTRRDALAALEDWIDYREARAEAESLGLGGFIDGLVRAQASPATWQDAFLRQVYTLWLTWRYAEAPALARFRGQSHQHVIAEFRQLDTWQLRAASGRIAARLRAKRPTASPNLPPRSEPALLMREASKRRRFRPLRKLFADLPNILPALKPCMLMSPLSVAQFLGESALQFDLIVFDEASQILPADAIGAISRGRQAVVVGDSKQLPPTNFFGTMLLGASEAEEDAYDESPESILDACTKVGMAEKRLRWHYRSRHEDLIAFSNRYFYDSDLVTFPSPDAGARAIDYIYVADGVYERARNRWNRVEARRVVDLVIEHVRAHPEQSLGVIAFSQKQMEVIEYELELRKRADPSLEPLLKEEGPDGFFVKNLETVQGDERDVIFFSVGYGFDEARKITMNFGPLNREGGERRLNVAVTRARDHVKVIASIQPQDIDRSRTNAKGVHLLRAYLEFAERGPIALLGEIASEGGEPESPFEEAVILALQERGLRVVSQVGVGGFRIDIGVKDEAADRYLLGVECDGATYHSSKTARDRDRLRQQVLENLGWRIHRVWSADWIKDPDRETAKIIAALDAARTQIPPPQEAADAVPPERTTEQGAQTVTVGQEDAPPPATQPHVSAQIAQPYTPVALPPQGGREAFDHMTGATLAPLVVECVRTEGPVDEDRMIRTVAASFGLRVGSRIEAKIMAAVASALERGQIVRREPFLWLPEMTEPPIRVSGGRTIHEIAPEEIAACITAFLRVAFSISRDDLVTGVAREFGFDRTGNQVSAGIRAMIEQMIAEGRAVDIGGQIRLPNHPTS